MPDNAPGGATTVAADELRTVNGEAQVEPLPKAQRVKIGHGGDGEFNDASIATPLPISLAQGTYGYAAGTAAATVDVPAAARVKRVSVIAGSGGAATVTIAGGAPITIPAGGSFDEQIPGDTALGADVVIAGAVSSYYVGWVA